MSIYLRGDIWHIYVVRNGKRTRASLRTTDRGEAESRAAKIEERLPAPESGAEWVFTEKWIAKRLWTMRERSKGKPDACMTRDELRSIVARSGGRCEVTGIPFSGTLAADCARAPYAPSIDRIDHRRGYAFDNCRLVCFAVNVAMNQWGEAVTRRIAMGFVARESCTVCATEAP